MQINSINQLRDLYDQPTERAQKKVQTELDKHCINFIQNSPFLCLSTYSLQAKMDVSPRGGAPAFVQVHNPNTLLIPDAKGNNRLDSLCNIIETKRVGLIFLIPGVDETLRINGSAHISTDDEYLKYFKNDKHPPKSCIVVNVEEAFLHCAKAFMRSKLWDPNSQINRTEFPTMGEMLKDHLKTDEPAETREDMLKRYQKDL